MMILRVSVMVALRFVRGEGITRERSDGSQGRLRNGSANSEIEGAQAPIAVFGDACRNG
jgi:hypothetical protein